MIKNWIIGLVFLYGFCQKITIQFIKIFPKKKENFVCKQVAAMRLRNTMNDGCRLQTGRCYAARGIYVDMLFCFGFESRWDVLFIEGMKRVMLF